MKTLILILSALSLMACSQGETISNAVNYKRLAYSCSGFVNSKAYHIDIYNTYGGSYRTYETDQNNQVRLGYMGPEADLNKDLLFYINNESLYLNIEQECQKF